MAVSKRLRYEILRRDSHTCRYCGATAPDVPLRVDHVTPVALGGTDTPGNLVTACQDCNSGKSSSTVDATLVANVSNDAIRWADAMKQAAANMLEEEKPKLEYRANFRAQWDRWEIADGKPLELPGDWKPSIERFRVAGLPAWVWGDIVDTAMGYEKVLNSNKFKYCCGVAWNKVSELHAGARAVVAPRSAPGSSASILASLTDFALQVWQSETEEPPTPAQAAELRSGVEEELDRGTGVERIIEAVKNAAWCGHASIPEGLLDIAQDARLMGTYMIWESSWIAATGQRPPSGETSEFQSYCSALAKTAADTRDLHTAATIAGFLGSPRPYYGLQVEHLEQAGISWIREHAIGVWILTSLANRLEWPTAEERAELDESLLKIRSDGNFLQHDVVIGAATAGAYGDTDLAYSITRNLSVFEVASQPLAGGVR
ncbi:HNH endonuclease [Streptomyces griseus]|uniref:HNH endonuclease n=1 Tax=Streptomyces griseus TaxID=1911 RepID=UPI00382FE24D